MKTKRVRKNGESKTPLSVILKTLEQYYEELKQDPVLTISATHIWHAAEDIRVMRSLALKVMLEKKSGETNGISNEDDDGESKGVWTPLSCMPHYGVLKQ
ncbi:MAG: hypothetical protein SGJ17_07980 [Hyphomicrobiales bacterium]|nr:hypothetical protein [Hyphomicrobiales bacterium]